MFVSSYKLRSYDNMLRYSVPVVDLVTYYYKR